MSRFINADEAKSEMLKLLDHHLMMGNYSADSATGDCIEILNNTPTVNAVEISEKELVALMASAFALRNSKELKHGGMYVENFYDENSRRISFQEALDVLYNFIDRILEGSDEE